jgi:hypothetical protein
MSTGQPPDEESPRIGPGQPGYGAVIDRQFNGAAGPAAIRHALFMRRA